MTIDDTAGASRIEPPEGIPTEPRRILVADDEHLVATGMAESLRELGYEVVGPAADGDEALLLCESEQPDLALLDIQMPRKSGLVVAEEIFRRLGIPVVIFSAYSDAEYVEAGNRVGVFGYLLKPVTQDQLRIGVSVSWMRYIEFLTHSSEIDRLKARLEHRKVVEQAKWILVQRKSITEPEAMRLLQRQARNNRRPLVEVARSLLENEELFA